MPLRVLGPIILIILLCGCQNDNACIDFISPDDLEISQVLHCSEECGPCIHLRVAPKDPSKNLKLNYSWRFENADGTHADDGALFCVVREATGYVTLVVENLGCSLEMDVDLMEPDAALPEGGTISNQVWMEDHNVPQGLNVLDDQDKLLQGVVVDLLSASDYSLVMRDTTDSNGLYSFEDVMGGDYVIRFHPLANTHFVIPKQSADEMLDSDSNVSGYTEIFHMGHCQSVLSIGAGIHADSPICELICGH